MGSTTHQQSDVEERGALGLFPKDVDLVAHPLKGEEGDGDRQDDFHDRHITFPPGGVEDDDHLFEEEAVIFEEAEDGEIDGDADDQPKFGAAEAVHCGSACVAFRSALGLQNEFRDCPVQYAAGDEQRDKAPIPCAIEDPRADKQQDLAPFIVPARPDNRKQRDEKQVKGQGRKQHYFFRPPAKTIREILLPGRRPARAHRLRKIVR